MAYRVITHVIRDEDGEILMLCNRQEVWSPRIREDVIDDIESGLHTYYLDDGTGVMNIAVSNHPVKGKILVALPQGRGPVSRPA